MADVRAEISPVEYLHGLRKAIDADIQRVGELKQAEEFKGSGREVALAYTKLQEAKMWLGKALGALGSKLPEEYRDEAQSS